jgi:outer membrane protein assembly factor BamE (lipoprotein component of BamABCDE complex)
MLGRYANLHPFDKRPGLPGPAAQASGSRSRMTLLSRRTALLGLVSASALALAGCGPDAGGFKLTTSSGLNEEYNRGFIMDDALIAKIRPGMDVQTVLATLGTPSTTSTVGNRTFYYISQRVRRRFQFQNLEVVDQKVLVIYFNKAFKVERIANYGLQDGVIFDFISRTTPTGGEEQSFLRNLFRGVTRFNPLGS